LLAAACIAEAIEKRLVRIIIVPILGQNLNCRLELDNRNV